MEPGLKRGLGRSHTAVRGLYSDTAVPLTERGWEHLVIDEATTTFDDILDVRTGPDCAIVSNPLRAIEDQKVFRGRGVAGVRIRVVENVVVGAVRPATDGAREVGNHHDDAVSAVAACA